MKVLIAYDGSPSAEQAVDLADHLNWPAGSTLRVVTVMDPTFLYIGRPPLASVSAPEIEAELTAFSRELAGKAAEKLGRAGRNVENEVLRGRPGTVLVEEAARFGADVVIAGSRGHGQISSLLLGSVSAEVVDHAPCPVLSARGGSCSRIVLAVDGSEPASGATSLVGSWPIFSGVPVTVVSVADVVEPWHSGIAPTMYQEVAEAQARDLADARAEHARIAEATVTELRSVDREVTEQVRSGDAASEIIAAAQETAADLIVMGSRGRTGLTRLILGSVARNVVQGSPASVLIVHAPG